MPTILVAAILIIAIIIICLLLISITNQQKKHLMNQILKHFSKLGTHFNLSFSSQEILSNVVIGLDGINRKILILEYMGSTLNDYVIDLNEVKHCSVKKYYGNIKADGLRTDVIDTFLEKVCVHFEMHKGKDSHEVVFYNHIYNHVYQLSVLEQKATHWKELLTKMLKAGKAEISNS